MIPGVTPYPHHFTVDVEEYFQVVALAPHISRDAWDDIPSRVEASVDRLLALLASTLAFARFTGTLWLFDRCIAHVTNL